ncbi:hypothetical protein L596_023482 [Steinernema carpocapsae]|uniref:Uncharacterized protein n=1 Tax=Steinernema carpocapsae TaxID=34508 RepID=A0A4U5MDR4_STECR|nr:hypothetical protein L596_023482 [Steinernema carpocapsae]
MSFPASPPKFHRSTLEEEIPIVFAADLSAEDFSAYKVYKFPVTSKQGCLLASTSPLQVQIRLFSSPRSTRGHVLESRRRKPIKNVEMKWNGTLI